MIERQERKAFSSSITALKMEENLKIKDLTMKQHPFISMVMVFFRNFFSPMSISFP